MYRCIVFYILYIYIYIIYIYSIEALSSVSIHISYLNPSARYVLQGKNNIYLNHNLNRN